VDFKAFKDRITGFFCDIGAVEDKIFI